MEGKDKVVKTEVVEAGDSGYENRNRKSDPDASFWHSLRKQVEHGPAVRIRSSIDARRRSPRS